MYPEKMDYDQFKISDDGKTLYWVAGDKEIRITAILRSKVDMVEHGEKNSKHFASLEKKRFGCLSGPPGFTCWISFAPVFSLIYC